MTIQEEYFSNLSKVLKEKFNNKGFAFDSFSNKDEAKKFIMSLIKQDDVITFGGSTSVNQMGILEDLKSYKNFIDRNNKDIKSEAELKAFSSDVYFCSANAVTKNGDIIAIDGSGNRVAAIIYGPKKVFLVVGRNKVCNNEKDALKRAKDVAAAENSIRFKMDNPCCVNEMICNDNCDIDKRLCAYTVIINKCHIKDRIHIIFIDEELGF
ncbi:lactate utilization protein [uncultured Brachyspira sp.]|uniref:lactate utilization protein n=1 Tax=uncultured Brachyspira sp. TaxID=221953 RepID=UPI00262489F2|nr:lactate utilization protein [uncultured Brachyspira sp.]